MKKIRTTINSICQIAKKKRTKFILLIVLLILCTLINMISLSIGLTTTQQVIQNDISLKSINIDLSESITYQQIEKFLKELQLEKNIECTALMFSKMQSKEGFSFSTIYGNEEKVITITSGKALENDIRSTIIYSMPYTSEKINFKNDCFLIKGYFIFNNLTLTEKFNSSNIAIISNNDFISMNLNINAISLTLNENINSSTIMAIEDTCSTYFKNFKLSKVLNLSAEKQFNILLPNIVFSLLITILSFTNIYNLIQYLFALRKKEFLVYRYCGAPRNYILLDSFVLITFIDLIALITGTIIFALLIRVIKSFFIVYQYALFSVLITYIMTILISFIITLISSIPLIKKGLK